MTIWKHNKKILIDSLSIESCTHHENTFDSIYCNNYLDWYYGQIESGLANPDLDFKDICKKISDTEYEILVTDQTQADSYIAMVSAIAEQIGYPVKATVVDHTE